MTDAHRPPPPEEEVDPVPSEPTSSEPTSVESETVLDGGGAPSSPEQAACGDAGPASTTAAAEAAAGAEATDGPGPRRTADPLPLRNRAREAAARIVRGPVRLARALRLRADRLTERTRWVALGVTMVLVLAGGAGVGFLAWRAADDSATQRASQEGLEAARTRLSLVLSYSAVSLDADLRRAREQLAEPFAGQFDQLAAQLIAPSTRDQQISTVATVVRAGVISATPQQVETLLFVNQSTANESTPDPRNSSSQVRVKVSLSGGEWLISDIVPT